MRAKLINGKWKTPFNPRPSEHRNNEYTEGTAWQYSWFVPQDVEGLINLFGSKEKFTEKLGFAYSQLNQIWKAKTPAVILRE